MENLYVELMTEDEELIQYETSNIDKFNLKIEI